MAVNTSTIDGQDHIVGEGAFTRCGLRLAHGTPYEVDVEPENPCPVCFPDAKPKKAKAKTEDKPAKSETPPTVADEAKTGGKVAASPANSTKKSVGDKA